METELEVKDYRDAEVVFVQLRLARSEERFLVRLMVKNETPQIDKLVLPSHAPVIAQRIFQSCTHHSADIRVGRAPTFTEPSGRGRDDLRKIRITDCQATCHIRQKVTPGVADAEPNSGEVMRFERSVDMLGIEGAARIKNSRIA